MHSGISKGLQDLGVSEKLGGPDLGVLMIRILLFGVPS